MRDLSLAGAQSVRNGTLFPACTGSGWTAGELMGSRGSSPVTRARPPGPETGADAMVERACCE